MNLGADNFLLILTLEALAVCLFVIALLILKNRKLRTILGKFKDKVKELRQQIRKASTPPAPPPSPPPPEKYYKDMLSEQLALTKDYHHSLGTRQDIALDLDSDSPLPRRTAALRHALLIAEIEATATSDINWDFLSNRYQQILSFNKDDDEALDTLSTEEDLQQAQAELEQARKRINNLERFKALYLDLEERWEQCKGEASSHYTELKNLAAKSLQSEDFDTLLENYRESYNDVGALIEQGVIETIKPQADGEKHFVELQHLRSVAADQHRIITELKEKLSQADTEQEKQEAVETLQQELNKQARFLQESETCIQLMEDELETANNEVNLLRNKLSKLPEIKSQLKDLQSKVDQSETLVDSLKTENRRLSKKLKLTQEAPPEDSEEIRRLRKEYTTLQGKYNDLEEKFLDLKLKD